MTHHKRSTLKVFLKLGRVEGGGHDDELEIFAPPENFLDQTKEDVRGESPFVCFVEYDDGVLLEERIAHGLAK